VHRRDRRQRIETGVAEGDEISPFYDPMIAKLITHANSRRQALSQMRDMTAGLHCWPVKCNAGFLHLLLWDEDVEAGRLDTGLIERDLNDFIPDQLASDAVLQSVAHIVVDDALGGAAENIRETYLTSDTASRSLLGFRLNRRAAPIAVEITDGQNDYTVEFAEWSMDDCLWVSRQPEGFAVTDEGVTRMFTVVRADGTVGSSAHGGDILAPMPGKVIAVDVTEGQPVEAGQRLMVLEAMKMEHALTAPFAGTVTELAAHEGQQVQVEALLARVVKATS
jgi:3-methylcrotonyl-CoA carboxylase alpha subunit